MAFNLCVPEFNKSDIAIYLQKEFLKKKAIKIHEKNDNRKERYGKRGKKDKVSFQNGDVSEDSSSNDEGSSMQDLYTPVQKHNSCTSKKKRKVSDHQVVDRKDMPLKNTRETKLFRHF